MKSPQRQSVKGYSLVELLIAMALGLFGSEPEWQYFAARPM
jgi:prepilin-type N-terminal cleavage/methylation domain